LLRREASNGVFSGRPAGALTLSLPRCAESRLWREIVSGPVAQGDANGTMTAFGGIHHLGRREFTMKTKWLILGGIVAAVGLAGFTAGLSIGQEKKMSRVYELRTYTTLPGRLPALNKRFAEHTMKLFEKHGIKNEMYWIPTDAEHKDNTLIYIVSHESEEAAKKNWAAFQADPDWIKARDASEADGKILAKAPERVFMTLTNYSPAR
jgi:NIPSNAP protein